MQRRARFLPAKGAAYGLARAEQDDLAEFSKGVEANPKHRKPCQGVHDPIQSKYRIQEPACKCWHGLNAHGAPLHRLEHLQLSSFSNSEQRGKVQQNQRRNCSKHLLSTGDKDRLKILYFLAIKQE